MAKSDTRPTGDQEVANSNPTGSGNILFVEIYNEIISAVILSLSLIQNGQLSVSGERMYTNTALRPVCCRTYSNNCRRGNLEVNWVSLVRVRSASRCKQNIHLWKSNDSFS